MTSYSGGTEKDTLLVLTARAVLALALASPAASWAAEQTFPSNPPREMAGTAPGAESLTVDLNDDAFFDGRGDCGDPTCHACGMRAANCGGMGTCTLGLWGNVEYLLWWEKGMPLPPLVTTSTPTPNRENAGVLGFARTRILFGDESVDDDARSGFRITLGTWLDATQCWGIGARYFSLAESEADFRAGPDDFQFLARPFFNVITDEQDALLLTFPNDLSGSVDAQVRGDVSGWEGFFRWLRRQGCNYRIDMIAGYRYLNLEESVAINDQFQFIDPNSPEFGRVEVDRDFFGTRNTFNGADIGIMGTSQEGCWSLDFLLKVALGNMRQIIDIQGSHTVTVPGEDPVTNAGGLLTQPSNIGRFEEDKFAWIPECSINLGCQMSPHLDCSFGYNFIYVADVLRAGTEIDPAVNLTQRIGPPIGEARPRVLLDQRDYWLQGLNFGITWEY